MLISRAFFSVLSRAPLTAQRAAMSSSVVHGHSGRSVPADADLKAAWDGEPQMHGSGGEAAAGSDPKAHDPVHGHSGTSVPADADVKAAKEGEPQFAGSGAPLDVDTIATEKDDGQGSKV